MKQDKFMEYLQDRVNEMQRRVEYRNEHPDEDGLVDVILGTELECFEEVLEVYQQIHPPCPIATNNPF